MGVVSWILGGIIAALAAWALRPGRRGRKGEIVLALFAALISGLAATALDFGGWNEPDWRAGLFATLAAFAAIALFRLIGLLQR